MPSGSTTRPLAEELLLDLDHECLIHKGKPLDMGKREFAVLKFLYERHPARCQGPKILEAVWTDVIVGANCVPQTARRLQKRFEDWGISYLIDIESTHLGYRLVLPRLASSHEEVDQVVLTETHLIAFGLFGKELWKYRFASPSRRFSREEMDWRLQRVDLNDDDDMGVLATVQPNDSSKPTAIYYFSSNGGLQWSLDVEPRLLTRVGKPFERAWAIKQVVVDSSQDGKAVWAAICNHAGWAGCVLRIDANGSPVVHFANAGYVEGLCTVVRQDELFIIACGENNDFDDSFVALIRANDPPARSIPGERLVYRFANSSLGAPRKYILFPKTELIAARSKPYGHATRIAQHLDGIIVEVETGGEGAHFRYHFSKDLEPRYVFPSGSHEFVHQALEKNGALTHAWLECPELRVPLLLRVWERDSGWYDQPISWRDNPWAEIQNTHK